MSNGAVFMPNTMTMQQINRASSDHFRETLDEKGFAKCVMLRIPKGIYDCLVVGATYSTSTIGTVIPSSLTLFHEYNVRFSLQPSNPMALSGTFSLNRSRISHCLFLRRSQ